MFSQGATLAKLPPKSHALGSKNQLLGSRLTPFWVPWGVLGPTLGPKRLHKGSDTTEQEKLEKPGSGNLGSAARGGDLWRPRKTADSEKSITKHWGKRTSGEMA